MAKEVLEMEVKSNIGDVAKDTEKLAKSTGSAKKGFKGMGTAIKGVGVALKAAGIGLIIALFAALKEALGRNQKAMELMETVMTTISITFNQIVNVLTDVVVWVTASSERFNGLGKVLMGLINLSLTPIKLAFYGLELQVLKVQLAWERWLGGADPKKMAEMRKGILETSNALVQVTESAIEAGKDIYNNFGDAVSEIKDIYAKTAEGITKISIKSNFEIATATTAANKAAKIAEAGLQGLIETNKKLAEIQRQIRDDETKTFAERIAANKELNNVLDKQEIDMLALSDKKIAAAKLELGANKDNLELQNAYQQTLTDRAGVEAQIAGLRSEQLKNQGDLEKELAETQKEIRAEGMSGLEKELQELKDAYDLKLEMARKSGMKTTAITKEYEKQKSDLVKANMLVQLDAYANLAGALSTLAGENKELAVAEAVMATWSGATKALSEGAGTPAGWINAAAIIAAGLSNVSKIMAVDVPGTTGGGGSGGIDMPVVDEALPAPQMMSGAFDISGGVAPEPLEAYVLTDSMTNSQNQLANIRRRATI